MTPALTIVAVLLAAAVVVSVRLTVIDLREHRLPNRLVGWLYPIGLAAAVGVAVDAGSPWPVTGALAGGLVLFAGYYLLHRRGGGMGGGDVKLAGALGLLTGAWGWQAPILATALAFVAGGVTALALIAARRAHRRSRIAFGPFMLFGAWVALGAAVVTRIAAVNPAVSGGVIPLS